MEETAVGATFQKYHAYKESGAPWIGDIPSHWSTEKGKWLFIKNDRPVRKIDDIVTCFRDGEVTLRSNRRSDGFTNALKEHGYQGIRKGDLVIHAMDAFAGAVGVSDSDGKSTPVYSVCTPRFDNTVNQYYYAYFIRNLALNGVITSLAKGIRERSTDFRFNDFGELTLSFPPLTEQTAIANFLDDKTAKIDRAIAQKEQLIALLKERKQIIIQNAVSKGLDPNVKMKDSGVEWIGEIPEHWEVIELKYALKNVGDVDHYMPPTLEHGVPYLMTGDLEDFASKIDFKNSKKVSAKAFQDLSNKIKTEKGDVILARYATIGTVTYVDINIPFLVSYSCVTIKPDTSILSGLYLYYYFKSDAFSTGITSMVNTNTQGNVGIGDLRRIKIVLPKIKDQKKMEAYFRDQDLKFDQAISLQQSQIEKLKEYKASLIDSAVTGKIKVS